MKFEHILVPHLLWCFISQFVIQIENVVLMITKHSTIWVSIWS